LLTGRAIPAMGAAAACGASAFAAPMPLVTDGVIEEWAGAARVTDAPNDHRGDFDVRALAAATDNATLHLLLELADERTLQSGADDAGTLVIAIKLPDGRTLETDLRGRSFELIGGSRRIGWSDLDYRSAPTHSSRRFELRYDLAALGVEPTASVMITTRGGDTLDTPLTVELGGDRPDPRPIDLGAIARSPIRVASLNTERNGLADADRAPRLGRLLGALKPEILAIQEEYDASAAELAAALNQHAPRADGRAWLVHKDSDCAVATPNELVPLEAYDRGYAAALVRTDGGTWLCVLSIHPKCCGYKGSDEDQRRITQTQAMLRTINELRGADESSPVYEHRDAPIIVIGDWNLVGSRRPLAMLESENELGAPALTRGPLPHANGREVYTWRRDGSSFPPGVLDLLAYDAERLRLGGGAAIDTRTLTQDQLQQLDVERDDSAASDHTLLLAGFEEAS
jgi:hypothetical protein